MTRRASVDTGLLALSIGLTLIAGALGATRLQDQVASAAGGDGPVRVTGAWISRPVPGRRPSVYLSIHNGTGTDLMLEDVTSPAAASAGWVVPGHVHTLEEVANGSLCGDRPEDVQASARQLAATSDLIVLADSSRSLRPGQGRLELDHPLHPLRSGDRVPMVLSFSDGRYGQWTIDLDVPVREQAVDDPLPDP